MQEEVNTERTIKDKQRDKTRFELSYCRSSFIIYALNIPSSERPWEVAANLSAVAIKQ